MVHLAILRENPWSLPSQKTAKENGFVSGVVLLFLVSDRGPQGPSWPIHGPLPVVRWAEKKKWFILQF